MQKRCGQDFRKSNLWIRVDHFICSFIHSFTSSFIIYLIRVCNVTIIKVDLVMTNNTSLPFKGSSRLTKYLAFEGFKRLTLLQFFPL